MNRMKENCAHFLAALLIVAICITLVACASSKADAPQRQQFSSPPTQEEIDEFRRNHPVTGGSTHNASYDWPDINTLEGFGKFDLGVVVQIIGEQELRTVAANSGTYLFPYYRAKVIEVIFNNPIDEYFRNYVVNEELYVYQFDTAAFPMEIGDTYLLITYNFPDTKEQLNFWNGLRAIMCNISYSYYITDNSYIIGIDEPTVFKFNNTGRSSTEFIDMLRRYGAILNWDVRDSTFDENEDIALETESDQGSAGDDLSEIADTSDESKVDDSLVETEIHEEDRQLSDEHFDVDSVNNYGFSRR